MSRRGVHDGRARPASDAAWHGSQGRIASREAERRTRPGGPGRAGGCSAARSAASTRRRYARAGDRRLCLRLVQRGSAAARGRSGVDGSHAALSGATSAERTCRTATSRGARLQPASRSERRGVGARCGAASATRLVPQPAPAGAGTADGTGSRRRRHAVPRRGRHGQVQATTKARLGHGGRRASRQQAERVDVPVRTRPRRGRRGGHAGRCVTASCSHRLGRRRHPPRPCCRERRRPSRAGAASRRSRRRSRS